MAGALGRASHGNSAVRRLCVNPSLSSICAASAFSRDEGEESREKCVDGALGRASHGNSAVRPK